METKRKVTSLWVGAAVVLLAGVLALPPVWSRVSYHSFELYRTVRYWIKPPSEAVFVPSTHQEAPVGGTVAAVSAVSTSTPAAAAQPAAISTQPPKPTGLPAVTATPAEPEGVAPTPLPLPDSVLLEGVSAEQQAMNNCGPATLSMYLSFYDWEKTQREAAAVLKPNAKDVNVMPYEVVDFVNNHTEQRALWRYGGDLQTLKVLLNAGYPVMIEKSFEPFDLRNEGWMGHYNLVVGYSDERETLTVHDSYLMIHPPWGAEIPPSMWDTFTGFDFYYDQLEQAWRSFNFVFIVVFPPEKESEVLALLGPLASQEAAVQIAYERAMRETAALTDVRDQFFAWFNAGTSLVSMEDYAAAAAAFDTAFELYPQIRTESRPYRILWYEEGPYAAYYHAGRYQDVINLANQTLGYMAEPVLEESYYWRAQSQHALGNVEDAMSDLRLSLKHHPGYAPSLAMLQQLGEKP